MYKVYWSDNEGIVISTHSTKMHALEYIEANQKPNDKFVLYQVFYKVSSNGPVSEKKKKIFEKTS